MAPTAAFPTGHPYWPGAVGACGRFVALEGVGCSGKSTLAAILARRWKCPNLHTAPTPLDRLQPYVNTRAGALPHLVFYLGGALHVSDLARAALTLGHVVADRYTGSVVANHAAIHHTNTRDTQAVIEPFAHYLLRPHITVYLHTPVDEILERSRRRGRTDRRALTPELVQRLQARFDEVAARDPTALHVATASRTPDEIAEFVTRALAEAVT
ncbi:deoxynucleoside kinase [Streptomyces sp. SID3343]|uniref:deoxynucleoside kinase n=1 Tax=Streptomyces sp. SID3343 TaxID=2690260 RepID=UPI00136C0B2F|nr:deoxynucleoside kinase [Streptomyces sp. SID3343]